MEQQVENKQQEEKELSTLDRVALWLIIVNTIVIIIQEFGYDTLLLALLDHALTLFFLVELCIKIKDQTLKGYWSDGWNKMDFIIIVLSLPSLIDGLVDFNTKIFSIFLAVRTLRILKFLRIMQFLPDAGRLVAGFKRALHTSSSVFVTMSILILIFALICCSMFKDCAPEYFSTPVEAVYSIFRLFTIEGWYEIPDAVAQGMNEENFDLPLLDNDNTIRIIRFFFAFLLIIGGIIGMSFVNSVFVDAMVEDNNDKLEKQVDDLNKKIESLEGKIDELLKK